MPCFCFPLNALRSGLLLAFSEPALALEALAVRALFDWSKVLRSELKSDLQQSRGGSVSRKAGVSGVSPLSYTSDMDKE